MRAARQAARTSLREMARRLNYGSHSSLSEYELGARMAPETVIEGYERHLGLAPGTLMKVLEAANIERHGDAWSRRRSHLPLPSEANKDQPQTFKETTSMTAGGRPFTTIAASPWEQQPVVDGSDPDAAGCALDATTVHARRIALAQRRTIIGHVELRYCARVHAAWARFEGYAFLDHLARTQDVHVIVEIARHRDGTRLSTREEYCFDLIWGELLLTDSGAFHAAATVLIDEVAVASGQTDVCTLD